MTETSASERRPVSLGIVLIITGVLVLLLVPDIQAVAVGSNEDPGPRAFPVALSLCLIVGGVVDLILAVRQPKEMGRGAPATAFPATVKGLFSEPRNWDVVFLLGALALYLPAMSWVGFSVSTLVFTTALMRRLGTSWFRALGTAVVLIVLIHLLFSNLFKVQLPAGTLGLELPSSWISELESPHEGRANVLVSRECTESAMAQVPQSLAPPKQGVERECDSRSAPRIPLCL